MELSGEEFKLLKFLKNMRYDHFKLRVILRIDCW